jgi:hypothetical protein
MSALCSPPSDVAVFPPAEPDAYYAQTLPKRPPQRSLSRGAALERYTEVGFPPAFNTPEFCGFLDMAARLCGGVYDGNLRPCIRIYLFGKDEGQARFDRLMSEFPDWLTLV